MPWTDIANKAKSDLFGFKQHAQLSDNLTYLHDTILGDPAANSDAVDFAQGGVTFSHANGMEVDEDLVLTGEIIGSRVVIPITSEGALTTTDQYLAPGDIFSGTPAPCGIIMPRAGSIIAANYWVNVISHVSNITVTTRIRKNDSNLIALAAFTATTTTIYTDTDTYARDTHTFVADDEIEFYADITSTGDIVCYFMVAIEIIFDT